MRWILLLALAAPALLSAQSTRARDLASGKLLVASRDLADPNFAESVVLLVHYDDEGVVGLIINRRTKVPIARALEELKGAKGRADAIYAGGPVGRTAVLALVRSRSKVETADRVFGDVHLVTTEALLEKTLAGGMQSDALHVYVGYAGWTPRQLEGEVELGAWYIFPGDAGAVFAADPGAVWSRLIGKTEERVAVTLPPATSPSRLVP